MRSIGGWAAAGLVLGLGAGPVHGVEFDLSPERTREALEHGRRAADGDDARLTSEWTQPVRMPKVRGQVRILTEYCMLAIAGREMAQRRLEGGPNFSEILCELSTERMVYFVVRLEAEEEAEATVRRARVRRADGRQVKPAKSRVEAAYRDPSRKDAFVAHSSFMFPPGELDLKGRIEFVLERPRRPRITVPFDLGAIR